MHKKIIEAELDGFGIKLNKKPPAINIRKKDRGGIGIIENKKLTKLDHDTIKVLLKEYKKVNVDITFNCDADEDDLIDVLEGNRKYIPCIYVLNKIDAISYEELQILDKIPHFVPISAKIGWNLEELFETIWDYLRFIRIYTKPKGEIPDYESPVILKRSKSSIEHFCNKIHRSIIHQFKYAWVWGSSVKHNP